MRFTGSLPRILAILLLLALFACTPATEAPQTETTILDAVTTTATPLPSDGPTTTPTQTATITATATPDMDWRDAPIMPEISARALEIYQDGVTQGRDPRALSVIGDCQSIPFVFLGPFGVGELAPDSAESYLWDAYTQFEPSFHRWSVTSRGGFTAASILSPLQADPHECKTGETPLTCEYRLNNPSIMFITLETWLDPNTIDRYETYLRNILEYVIAQGTLPILITKADSAELASGTPVINPVVVRLAHEYDVPVINFWKAAQYLENGGIDPERGTFHLSQDGYDLKNILALRALYAVWQAVDQESAGTGQVSSTPTPQAGNDAQPLPQITAPDCTGGCVFFGAAAAHDGTVAARGVFAYNYATKSLTSILGEGFDLQDVSADGQRLLVNRANFLYEVSLSSGAATLVSDSFFFLGQQGAYWNSDDSAPVYLDASQPIQTETGSAINLSPSPRDGQVYFASGACASQNDCLTTGNYRLDADQTLTRLEAFLNPVFSPDGKYAAYLNPAAANKDNDYHISYLLMQEPDRGIASQRVFYFPEEHGFMVHPNVHAYSFSPDNTKLFILYDVYSSYFERSLRLKGYLLDLNTGILYEYGQIEAATSAYQPLLVSQSSRLVWSPDSVQTLTFLTNVSAESQYSIGIYQSVLGTGEKLVPYDQGLLASNEYFYVTTIFWR